MYLYNYIGLMQDFLLQDLNKALVIHGYVIASHSFSLKVLTENDRSYHSLYMYLSPHSHYSCTSVQSISVNTPLDVPRNCSLICPLV